MKSKNEAEKSKLEHKKQVIIPRDTFVEEMTARKDELPIRAQVEKAPMSYQSVFDEDKSPELIIPVEKSSTNKKMIIVAASIIVVLALIGVIFSTIRYEKSDDSKLPKIINNSTSEDDGSANQAEETPVMTQSVYPASDSNPAYNLLFLYSKVNRFDACQQTSSSECGGLIGNAFGREDVQLSLYDSAISGSKGNPADDTQCMQSELSVKNNGEDVYICEVGLTGRILYYSFAVNLGGRPHYGIFTGINPRGRAFTDMSYYNSEFTQMLESINLQ